MSETKQRLLDAAEGVLAEQGFEAASLRAITSAAEANLASVNYHFGSKERLMQAVIRRRLGPVNEERLALLEACEREARPGAPPVDRIAFALIAPMVRALAGPGRDFRTFGRIVGGLYLDPRERAGRMLVPELTLMFERFVGALHRALPEIPRAELGWRVFFAVGSVVHYVAAGGLLRAISGGVCEPADVEQDIGRLVRFAAAGLCTKGPSGPRRETDPSQKRPKRRPGKP